MSNPKTALARVVYLGATLAGTTTLPAQTLSAFELAEEFPSICGRIGIRARDSAAIDMFWANQDWKKLIGLAHSRPKAKGLEYEGAALEYLTLLEIKQDRKAATAHARDVLRLFHKKPSALVNFVRRAVLSRPAIADYQFARMAMAAIVPDHRHSAAVRVTHLAAQLGSGRVKEAVITNKTIVEDLGEDVDGLLDLANTICDSKHGRSMAMTASRAIDKAVATRFPTLATKLARFRLLDGFLDRKAEARALAKDLLAKMDTAGLNDWIWDLLARRQNAGRYHALALLASEHMEKVATLDYHEYDTMALAWFCNGHVDRAIELQTRALQLGGKRDPAYRRRMERYVAARQTRTRSGTDATKRKH